MDTEDLRGGVERQGVDVPRVALVRIYVTWFE